MNVLAAGLLTMSVAMAQGGDVQGKWSLSALESNGTAIGIPTNERRAFVEFKGAELSGNTGCNNFFGGYELRGNQLNMGENVGMTRMMCAPESMAVEDALVQVFTGQSTIEIRGNMLTIQKNNIRATFTK